MKNKSIQPKKTTTDLYTVPLRLACWSFTHKNTFKHDLHAHIQLCKRKVLVKSVPKTSTVIEFNFTSVACI